MSILYNKKEKEIRFILNNDVMDKLYYLDVSVPNEKQINKYLKSGVNDNVLQFMHNNNNNPSKIIKNIKEHISKIDNKIPLYDEYTKNLYIINRENVYKRIINQSYRFPDNELIKIFKDRKNQLESNIIKNMDNIEFKNFENLGEIEQNEQIKQIEPTKLHKTVTMRREYRKLQLMLDFLNSFDIDILQTTYIKVFYFYSNEVGKNITVCQKPSFIPYYKHIKPYYTRSELINLALNMEIINPSNEYYDQNKIMILCDKVKNNDISATTITKHQKYIVDNDGVGLIQYYSLNGSSAINNYLRNNVPYPYQNKLLEDNIINIWKLTENAPAFDKSYILYRFIHTDEFLRNLKIGDVFVDNGFISTTRDPFYESDTYKFGVILLRIKIPAGISGVGLCIESFSNFPSEEEILLSPKSKLKLDRIDEDTIYYHTDEQFSSKIKRKYEFTYINQKQKVELNIRPQLSVSKEINPIDFLNIKKPYVLTLQERIKLFVTNHINPIKQFHYKFGNKYYPLIIENYNSTGAYKEFYALTTYSGFSIYTIINKYIEFFIELGEENEKYPIMYVNYYFKYSTVGKKKNINDTELIDFISKVAYYFNIPKIMIFAEYAACDKTKNKLSNSYGGNYCVDFYRYLKYGTKRFQEIDSIVLKSQFSYYELDRLKNADPYLILYKEDRDELFQIYSKTYKLLLDNKKHNIADFYVWIVDNQCINSKLLITKMGRFYNTNNPFDNRDKYILDPIVYLYNKNLIKEYSLDTYSDEEGLESAPLDVYVPKNEYRIEQYRNKRIIETE